VTVAAVLVAAVLVAYAACLGMLGSRMLGRARWTSRAPLLAIVVYLAAGWSVMAAVGLAGLTLAVHATALGGGLSHLIGACVLRLRATYGTPVGQTGGVGAVDARLSPDGRFLYVDESRIGKVGAFAVNGGNLTELSTSPFALPAGATPAGIAAN